MKSVKIKELTLARSGFKLFEIPSLVIKIELISKNFQIPTPGPQMSFQILHKVWL